MAGFVREDEKSEDEDEREEVGGEIGGDHKFVRCAILSGTSARHCNNSSARFVPGPPIPMQRVVDRRDGGHLPGMVLDHATDDIYDWHARMFSGEESRDGGVVRGVID